MLRPLRWGDSAGLSSWVQCNHEGLSKREPGMSEWVKTWQWKPGSEKKRFEDAMRLVLKMEDGDHEPRNASSLQKVEKIRKWILPQNPPGGMHPCWHFGFRISELQNCEVINLCCFKLISLWQYVTAEKEMNTPSNILYNLLVLSIYFLSLPLLDCTLWRRNFYLLLLLLKYTKHLANSRCSVNVNVWLKR